MKRTLHQHHWTYSTGSSNKIFVRILFVLIVARLFSLNGLFIIWLCVRVWAPLFALMVLFSLLSSWSWDWTLPLSRVAIRIFHNFQRAFTESNQTNSFERWESDFKVNRTNWFGCGGSKNYCNDCVDGYYRKVKFVKGADSHYKTVNLEIMSLLI